MCLKVFYVSVMQTHLIINSSIAMYIDHIHTNSKLGRESPLNFSNVLYKNSLLSRMYTRHNMAIDKTLQ